MTYIHETAILDPGVEIGDSIEITLATENCFAFTKEHNRINFNDEIS